MLQMENCGKTHDTEGEAGISSAWLQSSRALGPISHPAQAHISYNIPDRTEHHTALESANKNPRENLGLSDIFI